MILKTSFVLLFLFFQLSIPMKKGDFDNSEKINIGELNQFVKQFRRTLSTKDLDSLKTYFAHDFYVEFLSKTDSLRNTNFEKISSSLRKRQFKCTVHNDSTAVLALGKTDKIVGHSMGYYFIRKRFGGYFFFEFRASK
jgi:hypothetical protein